MPKNTPMTKQVMTNICRTFHLAFKGMDADEIYDVMMSLLLRAALKYDPLYSEKVARVIEVIKNPELIGRTFTVNDLNNHLDFDGARFVRVLCRNGFLEPLPEDGKPRRYKRKADAWRKRLTKFLHAGPVGFTYYIQMWFRYYLEMHIESAMGELEAKEGVYSLDYNEEFEDGRHLSGVLNPEHTVMDGPGRDVAGSLANAPAALDLTQMDMDWVAHTEDAIFSDLSREDRYLLYLVFVRDFKWKQVGQECRSPAKSARTRPNI